MAASMDIGVHPNWACLFVHDVTPDDLFALAVELRQAQDAHRLAATQAVLVELEKGA